MRSDNPHFARASPKEILCQLEMLLFDLLDKLLTYYCSSSFLIFIVLYLYSQSGAAIHRSFQNIKKTLKSVVLAFFCDFSADNLSSAEVAKYLALGSSN